jgi:hypothetical protein
MIIVSLPARLVDAPGGARPRRLPKVRRMRRTSTTTAVLQEVLRRRSAPPRAGERAKAASADDGGAPVNEGCEDVHARRDLAGLRDANLNPDGVRRLAAHLGRCETCRIVAADIAADTADVEGVTPALSRRLHRRIATARHDRAVRSCSAAGAATRPRRQVARSAPRRSYCAKLAAPRPSSHTRRRQRAASSSPMGLQRGPL